MRTKVVLICAVAIALCCGPWIWLHFLDAQLGAAVARGDGTRVAWCLRLGASVSTRVACPRDVSPGGDSASPMESIPGTVLHLAALNNRTGVIGLLLEKGADVNATDGHGRTPLHLAVLRGSTEAARCLLAHDAQPDVKDRDGVTPLYEACVRRQNGVAAVLLAPGATPDPKYLRLLSAAAPRSRQDAGEQLGKAVAENDVMRVEWLLRLGAPVATEVVCYPMPPRERGE